jgi:hypothetical protein
MMTAIIGVPKQVGGSDTKVFTGWEGMAGHCVFAIADTKAVASATEWSSWRRGASGLCVEPAIWLGYAAA